MKSNLSPHKKRLGKLGEDLASSYLHKQGYRIVVRNFRIRYGEIDIICLKDSTLVCIEVKTRIGHSFGKPEEAVTRAKLHEVMKTAQFFALQNPNLPQSMRIDVIGIELGDDLGIVNFNHIQNVTL